MLASVEEMSSTQQLLSVLTATIATPWTQTQVRWQNTHAHQATKAMEAHLGRVLRLDAPCASQETTVMGQTQPRQRAPLVTSAQQEPCSPLSILVQPVENQQQAKPQLLGALLAPQTSSVLREASSSTIAHPARSAQDKLLTQWRSSAQMDSTRLVMLALLVM